MRSFFKVTVLSCLSLAGIATAQMQGGGDANRILATTREALGGEQKLSAVKTLVATGRTRQVRGNNLVPIEFEIACDLPDKYARRDEIPAQESGPTVTGFNAETLIQIPAPPEPPVRPPTPAVAPTSAPAPSAPAAATAGTPASSPADPAARPVAPPPDPRKARLNAVKQDFVRLTLGLFAGSFSSYPLTFTLDGQAEAPQGKADIIGVKGQDDFAVRLLISQDTHLPIMLTWSMPATNVVMRVPGQPAPENVAPGSVVIDVPKPPAPTATKDEQAAYAKQVQDIRRKALATAKAVEYRVYYGDYRDIGNGLKFPFRIRRSVGAETVEEMNFDSFKTNVRIDPRRFTPTRVP